MKTSTLPLSITLALFVAIPLGCSKGDQAGESNDSSNIALTTALSSIDLSKVNAAFATASGAVQAGWDKVAAYLKGGDLNGAMESIKALAASTSLSADQKSALSELMQQIKSKAGDAMKGASDAAGKAVEQVKEAAGKAAEGASDAATKAKDLLPK